MLSENYQISPELQNKLNEHMLKECHSAFLYLAMSHWFAIDDLKGLAHWFALQSKEEYKHFEKFLKLFKDLKINPSFAEMEPVVNNWKNVGVDGILKQAINHEQAISTSIHELLNMARDENKPYVCKELNWFVDEQLEEENNISYLYELYVNRKSQPELIDFDISLLSREKNGKRRHKH